MSWRTPVCGEGRGPRRNIHLVASEHRGCGPQTQNIRAQDATAGILVVWKAFFHALGRAGLSGPAPVCEWATLLIDCAHDLGSMGPMARGNIGRSGMLDQADIVIGSFPDFCIQWRLRQREHYAAEYLPSQRPIPSPTRCRLCRPPWCWLRWKSSVPKKVGRCARGLDNVLYLRNK